MANDIPPNETHTYNKRSLARTAAMDLGLDLDELHVCRASDGKWGWIPLADWEAICGIKVAEEGFGPAPTDDAVVAEQVSPDEYIDFDQSLSDGPAVERVTAGLTELADEVAAEEYVPDDTLPDEAPVEPVIAVAPANDPTDGLLACDYELPRQSEEVFVQFADRMLHHAGLSTATQLAKRYQMAVAVVDADSGEVRQMFGRDGKEAGTKDREKVAKAPRRVAAGDGVGDDGVPLRPAINSAQHKSCEKALDKIDDLKERQALDEMVALIGTPGFKGGFTYGNMVVRYLNSCIAWVRDARAANDDAPLADAAD